MSYQEAVRLLQPVIVPVLDALQYGLDEATEEHARRGFRRDTDPWYFLHSVRRSAFERLAGLGLARTVDDGDRSLLNLSGLLVHHRELAVRILRPEQDSIPLPVSVALQNFYRQQALPGMDGADNLLLIWSDDAGVLREPLRLVRPAEGDARRDSLRLSWEGRLSRDLATLRARDLDELQPDLDYGLLGA